MREYRKSLKTPFCHPETCNLGKGTRVHKAGNVWRLRLHKAGHVWKLPLHKAGHMWRLRLQGMVTPVTFRVSGTSWHVTTGLLQVKSTIASISPCALPSMCIHSHMHSD